MKFRIIKRKVEENSNKFSTRQRSKHRWTAILASFFFVFSLLFLLLISQLPNINSLENYDFELPTRVYDKNNKLVGEFFVKKRILIDKENIPETLKQAVLAIEDQHFYSHIGIDIKRIIKTIWIDLSSLSFAQGASTITQQTAKLFLLSSDKKIIRKVKEILLAFQIESNFEKDEILELYLNKAYMGNGAWGVGAAANTYFSKRVQQLELGEIALLAGLVKAPSRLAPTNNMELAIERRNLVLQQMAKLEYITPQQLKIESKKKIVLNLSSLESRNAASYFIEEVRKKLQKLGFKEAYKKGWSVYTTLDLDLQLSAQNALEKGLIAIDKRHGYRGVEGTVLNEKNKLDAEKIGKIKTHNRFNQLSKASKAYIEEVTETKLLINLGEVKGEILLSDAGWALPWSPNRLVYENSLKNLHSIFKAGDEISVTRTNVVNRFRLYQEPINNGGLIAINPNNGHILAMTGGYSFQSSEFNRAVQSKRQSGSAFKPIVYATALDHGYTAASILEDTPLGSNDYGENFDWFPKNYGGNFLGNITFRESLYKSRNIPTVKLAIDLGISNIINYTKKLNIQSKLQRDLSISLGSASITLLELTNAYGAFANQGRQAVPYMIQRVENKDGKIMYKNFPVVEQVISLSTAYIITSILQDVIRKGTGKSVNVFSRPIAGKTGTTNENTDAWFIGYTPQIVAGVYVGNDKPTFSLGFLETGGRAAAPIWKNFMLGALKKYKVVGFPKPEGLQTKKIVKANGLLDCQDRVVSKEVYFEYFKTATAPTICYEGDIISSEENGIPTENIEVEESDKESLKEENFEL